MGNTLKGHMEEKINALGEKHMCSTILRAFVRFLLSMCCLTAVGEALLKANQFCEDKVRLGRHCWAAHS